MKRKWILIATGCLAVLGTGLFGYYKALEYNLVRYNRYDIRSAGSLQIGDLAPDLELESTDGGGVRKLSDYWGDRPLVLVFGSYT